MGESNSSTPLLPSNNNSSTTTPRSHSKWSLKNYLAVSHC